jgi:hypothetical protein
VASAIVDTTARVLPTDILKVAGITGIMLRAGLFPTHNPTHNRYDVTTQVASSSADCRLQRISNPPFISVEY